jgi:hypothetical protein
MPTLSAVGGRGKAHRAAAPALLRSVAVTRARVLRWILALMLPLAAIVGSSCAAPVLPIPPPTALVEGPPGPDGTVLVRGNARPGAFVGCMNEVREQGVIVRANVTTGDYALRIEADEGDELRVWQFEATSPGGEPRFISVPSR